MNRLTLTCLGICGLAWLLAAADVSSIQLKPEAEMGEMDSLADRSQGPLVWSNGAFLYMAVGRGGAIPWFYTLDREGRLLSSASLNIPEATQFWFSGQDRAPDGSIVFAGGAYAGSGQRSPFIAWINPKGETERVIQTAAYYVNMLSVAPDGTVWTIGNEAVEHRADGPGLDPNAGVLRHFDRGGTLVGSFFSQSQYLAKNQIIWLQSGFLVAKKDRLGWYGPKFGGLSRYVEIMLDSMTIQQYPGAPPLAERAHIAGFALTDDGTASLSINDPAAPTQARHWRTYTFDRATSKWSTAEAPASNHSPYFRVMGSDGNQLVVDQLRGVGFFSVPH